MNIDRLRLTLQKEESCNLQRHEVQSIDHIGWGINVEEELPEEVLDYLGVEDEDDIQEITQEQADWLLEYYIHIAKNDCVSVFGDRWSLFSPLRQELLANLSYNLGLPKFRKFRKMIAAVKDGHWNEAAAQILDSKAAREQAPARYKRLANAFSSDDEKFLELPEAFDTPIAGNDEVEIDRPLAGATDQELLDELARRLGL